MKTKLSACLEFHTIQSHSSYTVFNFKRDILVISICTVILTLLNTVDTIILKRRRFYERFFWLNDIHEALMMNSFMNKPDPVDRHFPRSSIRVATCQFPLAYNCDRWISPWIIYTMYWQSGGLEIGYHSSGEVTLTWSRFSSRPQSRLHVYFLHGTGFLRGMSVERSCYWMI